MFIFLCDFLYYSWLILRPAFLYFLLGFCQYTVQSNAGKNSPPKRPIMCRVGRSTRFLSRPTEPVYSLGRERLFTTLNTAEAGGGGLWDIMATVDC